MQYKGIELEGLDKKVELAHSRFYGTDEGADWLAKLLDADKTALSHIPARRSQRNRRCADCGVTGRGHV